MADEFTPNKGFGGFLDIFRAVPEGLERRKQAEEADVLREAFLGEIINAAARGEDPTKVGNAAQLQALGLIDPRAAAELGGRFGTLTSGADREQLFDSDLGRAFGAQSPQIEAQQRSNVNAENFQQVIRDLLTVQRRGQTEEIREDQIGGVQDTIGQAFKGQTGSQLEAGQVDREQASERVDGKLPAGASRTGVDKGLVGNTGFLFDAFQSALATGQPAAGVLGNLLVTSEAQRAGGGKGGSNRDPVLDRLKRVETLEQIRKLQREEAGSSLIGITGAANIAQALSEQVANSNNDPKVLERTTKLWKEFIADKNSKIAVAPELINLTLLVTAESDPQAIALLGKSLEEIRKVRPDLAKIIETGGQGFLQDLQILTPSQALPVLERQKAILQSQATRFTQTGR